MVSTFVGTEAGNGAHEFLLLTSVVHGVLGREGT